MCVDAETEKPFRGNIFSRWDSSVLLLWNIKVKTPQCVWDLFCHDYTLDKIEVRLIATQTRHSALNSFFNQSEDEEFLMPTFGILPLLTVASSADYSAGQKLIVLGLTSTQEMYHLLPGEKMENFDTTLTPQSRQQKWKYTGSG